MPAPACPPSCSWFDKRFPDNTQGPSSAADARRGAARIHTCDQQRSGAGWPSGQDRADHLRVNVPDTLAELEPGPCCRTTSASGSKVVALSDILNDILLSFTRVT